MWGGEGGDEGWGALTLGLEVHVYDVLGVQVLRGAGVAGDGGGSVVGGSVGEGCQRWMGGELRRVMMSEKEVERLR